MTFMVPPICFHYLSLEAAALKATTYNSIHQYYPIKVRGGLQRIMNSIKGACRALRRPREASKYLEKGIWEEQASIGHVW